MTDAKALAAAAKARGNAAFAKSDFATAASEFTTAIENDPTDHVFFSNRSACYSSLNKFQEALADANKCIEIKPDWAKGYSRQGVALFNLKKLDEAKASYAKGLSMEPNNQQMKEAFEQVNQAIEEKNAPPNPMGKLFGEGMWGKLTANPTTRAYLDDPAFVQKLKLLQQNPQMLGSFATDQRMSTAIGVILGIDLSGAGMGKPGAAGADMPMGDEEEDAPMGDAAGKEKEEEIHAVPKKEREASASGSGSGAASAAAGSAKPAASAKPTPAAAEPAKDKDQKGPALNKEAEDEKKKGNEFYSQRKFAEAVQHYEKAAEIDPKNSTYLSNISIAHFAAKQYDKCVEVCKKGLEVAQENQAGYEALGKFWLRIAECYVAQKNYDEAIKAFNKSLLEQTTDKARQGLKKAQELKKKADELAYLDKGKSLEAKERGNKLFADGKFVDALTEYSEAVKRDPDNAALYSNRAFCYTKLMDWSRALEDCEKALQLDPKFVKVYIRKAKIQHLLKQYKKALETYDAGLKLDPNASELIEGKRQTMQAIRSSSGTPDKARLDEAMKDPEVRQILNDPTMQKVLKDLQENPSAGQAAMRDKDIRANIEKLIAAGVLSVG